MLKKERKDNIEMLFVFLLFNMAWWEFNRPISEKKECKVLFLSLDSLLSLSSLIFRIIRKLPLYLVKIEEKEEAG